MYLIDSFNYLPDYFLNNIKNEILSTRKELNFMSVISRIVLGSSEKAPKQDSINFFIHLGENQQFKCSSDCRFLSVFADS